MSGHGAAKGSAEAADLAVQTQVLYNELQHRLTVVVARIRVWSSLGAAIASVVPSHDVDLIRDEEFQPKGVGRVNLLLIALGIRIEEYDRRVTKIVWLALKIIHFLWVCHISLFGCFPFCNGLNLLLTKWEEHAVQLCPILCLHCEPPAVEVLLKHLLELVVRVEHVDKFEATAVEPAATTANGSICSSDYATKL